VFADDDVEHHPLPPEFPTGRAAVKRFVAGIRAAFPDLTYTVEDTVAEGDRVSLRITAAARTAATGSCRRSHQPVARSPGAKCTSAASPMGGWWSTGQSSTSSACSNR
jgi:SnoaL-like polyketide cyclase